MDKTRLVNELLGGSVKGSFFGAEGFLIVEAENIEEAQLGYSVHPDGSDLTGDKDGDWLKSWVVFGRDACVGDPVFTDLSEEPMAVYTTMHGMGRWDGERISATVTGFLAALKRLSEATCQDSMLIEPVSGHFLTQEVRSKLLKEIESLVGDESKGYWENYFERYQDWVDESDEFEE